MCEMPQRSLKISTGWDRPGAASFSSGAAASAASGSSSAAAIIPVLNMAVPARFPSPAGVCHARAGIARSDSEAKQAGRDLLHKAVETERPGGDGKIDAILLGIGDRIVMHIGRCRLEVARLIGAGLVGIAATQHQRIFI